MKLEELTPEQEHYAAMEEFACDTRNIRFNETKANWRLMTDFLTDHSLPVTAPNLRFAFLSLSNDGLLDLLPTGHLAPPQPPQPEVTAAPTPLAQPAVVPVTAKTFRMFRNGNLITESVKSL